MADDAQRAHYVDVIAASLGVDTTSIDTPGVTVAGLETRRGRKVSVAYRLRERLVISCDPELQGVLADAVAQLEPDLDAWRHAALANGGELIANGRQQLLEGAHAKVPAAPPGMRLQSLRAEDEADRALIQELLDVTSADDAEEAEVAIDDLDPIIEALVDEQGRIASYVAARPFDLAPEFADIGILTRSDRRGRGLGAYLVASFCPRIHDQGWEPLYRCDEDNIGSVLLSERLGFTPVTRLTAHRFPHL